MLGLRKIQLAPKLHRKSTKWHQKAAKTAWPMLPWAGSGKAKTLRNTWWIGPSYCLCFSLFALSNFNGKVVWKGLICLTVAAAPKTRRNTKRIDPSKSNGVQNDAQNHPSGAKTRKSAVGWCSWRSPCCALVKDCCPRVPQNPPNIIFNELFRFLGPPCYIFENLRSLPGIINDFQWLVF